MSEENRNCEFRQEADRKQGQAAEQELSELLQIRRDKLKTLQEEGRDPFQITRFVRSAWSSDILKEFPN